MAAVPRLNLPTPPLVSDPALRAYLVDLTDAIGDWATQVEAQTGAKYAISNLTTNRSLDVSAATAAQVRQVLGTLISDLKKVPHIG